MQVSDSPPGHCCMELMLATLRVLNSLSAPKRRTTHVSVRSPVHCSMESRLNFDVLIIGGRQPGQDLVKLATIARQSVNDQQIQPSACDLKLNCLSSHQMSVNVVPFKGMHRRHPGSGRTRMLARHESMEFMKGEADLASPSLSQR